MGTADACEPHWKGPDDWEEVHNEVYEFGGYRNDSKRVSNRIEWPGVRHGD